MTGTARRPSGIVTFLFTDVAGSTRLWERDAAAMAEALECHDALCRDHFEQFGGYVFATGGDGFAVAFARPSDALRSATALQRALAEESWPVGASLSVRMALHSGEAVERAGDYFGTTVNTAARLLAVCHGGQVLVSDTTRQLVGDRGPLRDLGVHRLRDLGAPMRIWQDGDDQHPALRSLDATPGNLPSHLSALVGRDVDVAGVVDALGKHRLVTLTGVGGVGKTRLALAAAAEVAPDQPDGGWFVDLSAREADDDLAATVSTAIGADATTTDRALLLDYLRERRLVLVLDNCEHVLDPAAELVEDILQVATQVVMVATSREPLGVEGEHVIRVRSLAVPAETADRSSMLTASAVALFLERAADAAGVVDVDVDLTVVAAICRHLDGIPLAIELAAARTRAMTPAEILARIDERFRLLGGGRRSRDRHRTLAATVRWSYELLSSDEQAVWRRLSAFVGGFDVDAAEAVAERADTVEALLSLVDKSMVQVDVTTGRSRYWMLETLRQFAADRLLDEGEVHETRVRHSAHYLRRYGRDCPPLRGPDEYELWEMVAVDRDNVVVAAERLLERHDAAALVTEIISAPDYWIAVAPSDGLRLLELAAPAVDDKRAAAALGLASFLAWEAGDPANVVRLALDHVADASAIGLPLDGWAVASLLITGTFEPGIVTEAVLAAALAADEGGLRGVITNAAVPRYLRERGDPAWRDRFEVAEHAARRLESPSALGIVAVSRAGAEIAVGEIDLAIELLRAAERDVAMTPSTVGAWFHLLFGHALLDRDPPQALEHLRQAVRTSDTLGFGVVTYFSYEAIAVAYAEAGRLQDAALLAAVTRPYFDAPGRGLGEVGAPIRARLDGALADHHHRNAHDLARELSRDALLALALGPSTR